MGEREGFESISSLIVSHFRVLIFIFFLKE
jgi:hypothetical protein